jgi:NAD(P)-dependent dehydrogenase (short-subunit alcohol dehydrogenase family)
MSSPHVPTRSLVIVVTGANKGLGRETARQLLAAGHTVYIGSRDQVRGRRTADELGAHLLLLDVTDAHSVDAAAQQLRDEVGYVDVLVNNAGITGDLTTPTAQVTVDALAEIFSTNVFGTVRVTQALLPLLAAAAAPVIVNVSSGTGSFDRATDPNSFEFPWPALAYASSKAAVNMLTVQYAKALTSIRVNAVDPGYTATNSTGGRGKPVADGAEAIVRAAQITPDGPSGTFSDAAGTVPW